MKSWFQRFMLGRYGNDQLNVFLVILSLVFLVLGMLVSGILYYVGLALLAYCYFRMFSRNINKRYAENQWYLSRRGVVERWWNARRMRFQMRKTYHYYRCPHCRQQLRVPRGRGRISITCPKCGTTFIKKS